MAYIGQAAYISVHPEAYSNPFFNTVPPHMLYPSLVIAILAAIVASQAMITSTFQLLGQVVTSSYFPRINMRYTSDKFHGQLYINWPNWLMMIGTVIVTAVYSNTTSLGNAYGTCVVLVTFITTIMIGLVALIVWKIHWLIVLVVWLPFLVLDGLFLSSALTKVPQGAWFTLLLAAILSSIFVLWRYGKENQWSAERKTRRDLTKFIIKNDQDKWSYSSSKGIRPLNPITGMAIFFDKVGYGMPVVFEEFLNKFEALPEVSVFLTFKYLPRPYASAEDRYEIIRTAVPNCFRLIIRCGYNDNVETENLGEIVYTQLKQDIASTPMKQTPSDESKVTHTSRRLQTLEDAYSSQIVYVSTISDPFSSLIIIDCWKGTAPYYQAQHLEASHPSYLSLHSRQHQDQGHIHEGSH
jgi:KUP system potassium uptake protein